MPETADFIDLPDGRRIAYRRTPGSRPGIVFLGGFASDMDGSKALHLETWAQSRGAAFLRFDYTGHGKSSGRFEDGCISEWREDARDVINELTAGPQLLIGSSMGGWISLLLARSRPQNVAGIVGIATAPDFTHDFESGKLSAEQLRGMREKDKISVPSEYSEDGLVITRRLLDDGRSNFVLNEPLTLPFPVRLLQGTDDRDVDQSTAVRLLNHASCPDMRLLLVKGADHSFSSGKCLRLIEQAAEDILGG